MPIIKHLIISSARHLLRWEVFWEIMSKSPHSIMSYLCFVYKEKIGQHAVNKNDDQKIFIGTDQRGQTVSRRGRKCESRQQQILVEKKGYRAGLSQTHLTLCDLCSPVYLSVFYIIQSSPPPNHTTHSDTRIYVFHMTWLSHLQVGLIVSVWVYFNYFFPSSFQLCSFVMLHLNSSFFPSLSPLLSLIFSLTVLTQICILSVHDHPNVNNPLQLLLVQMLIVTVLRTI